MNIINNNKQASENKNKSRHSFLNMEKIGQIFIIFFISGCMFILGIFVGRGTAPIKFYTTNIQKEITKLIGTSSENKNNDNRDDNEVPEKPNLVFYEALKETNILKDFEKIIPTAMVNDDGNNKTIPASKEKNGKYSLQVAALKNNIKADNLVKELIEKGYAAYKICLKGNIKNEVWFKVRVGYFKTIRNAKNTLDKLKNDNFDAILVKR